MIQYFRIYYQSVRWRYFYVRQKQSNIIIVHNTWVQKQHCYTNLYGSIRSMFCIREMNSNLSHLLDEYFKKYPVGQILRQPLRLPAYILFLLLIVQKIFYTEITLLFKVALIILRWLKVQLNFSLYSPIFMDLLIMRYFIIRKNL